MLREYAVGLLLLALCFSPVSLAQLKTSGEFVAKMSILPDVELKQSLLTIAVEYGSWLFSSTSEFGPTGFTNQQFSCKGVVGPFTLTAGMAFNPTNGSTITINFPSYCDTQTASVLLQPPAYKWSWFEMSLLFAGLTISSRIEHWAYPYIPDWADPYYKTYTWPCCEPEQTPSSYMFFLFSAKFSPFFLDMRFSDCCLGLSFSDLSLGFDDLGLCCGTDLDLQFYFTKAGFQYALLSIENIPFICCGFAIDFTVKFTVEGKEVSLKPKWVGLGNVCVWVYGDVHMEGSSIVGIEVYGYKLRCELAPCHFVESMTVLSPEAVKKVEEIVGDIFENGETEYTRFGFCGQGCCGSDYTVDATIFFKPGNSLFGFSRVVVDMKVPLLANFSFTANFTLPSVGVPEMSMGFMFRF